MIVERDMHWEPTPFSQITGVEHPAEARGPQPDTGRVVSPERSMTPLLDPAPRSQARPGEKPGSKAPHLQCPECEEPAINHSATDSVPWEAHGLDRPEWAHADGSALCPVIGTSDRYEPAQPSARRAVPDCPGGTPIRQRATRIPRLAHAGDYEPEAA